jgi:hypothetical protein
MTIEAGDKVPSVTLTHMTADGPKEITTDELFAGKKVVRGVHAYLLGLAPARIRGQRRQDQSQGR